MSMSKTNSVVLLRHIESGDWFYSERHTTVKETTDDLKKWPMESDLYSFHGVYDSWLAAAKVSNELHEKEIETQVGKPLHPINKVIYD